MVAEDIRNLQRRARHARRASMAHRTPGRVVAGAARRLTVGVVPVPVLLPWRVLAKLFRRLMLEKLVAAPRCGSSRYHIVFTLPAAIADVACQNKAVVYDLLFKASAETMLTIAGDPNTWAPASASHLFCTAGARRSPTIRMST